MLHCILAVVLLAMLRKVGQYIREEMSCGCVGGWGWTCA